MKKTLSTIAAFLLFSQFLFAQNNNPTETKKAKMKEYILLIRLPMNYVHTEATKEKWNLLLQRWKADSSFVTSFVFPTEGYYLSGSEKTVHKESVVSDNRKVITTMIIRAADINEAVEKAKECPILELDGTVEVREIQQQPPVAR